MPTNKPFIHPYIPNSAPGIKADMLKEIGIKDVEEIYEVIPEHLRLKRKLNLPEAHPSEYELKRHVKGILSENKTCESYLNFLGGGCWQHYVPSVCNEIISRSEFLTAYGGTPYSTFGRMQAQFEFQSLMGELVGMDVVSEGSYSWGTVAGNAIRMACRMTDRLEVLIPKNISPERLATIHTFCRSAQEKNNILIKGIEYDLETGLMDLRDLKDKISQQTAGIYFENPTFLGSIESQAEEISEIAHSRGAESIVGVDPISLGVLAPPSDYGADIVVGNAQPLGVHMNYGGGLFGFIASRDEERYVAEYPSWLISIGETAEEDEYGFGFTRFERTSYIGRDKSKDFLGTVAGLWTIAAAVYISLMGPKGFQEIGETILQRAHYAIDALSEVSGVKVLFPKNAFKEFVVNFDETGKSVKAINKALLDFNIFGGIDLSEDFSELGNSSLYCVTEIHSKQDIDRLAKSFKEVLAK
ncbi:MAG: aminomethyl-transferring glycine dehydrogenase subunit GcvPA [Deltaproteobacteria bacterium]|nr:MAG: aminomethyl-transferring glycine dehydrogenase subunit GcvPA [Deltaproteobacteria bacterium]